MIEILPEAPPASHMFDFPDYRGRTSDCFSCTFRMPRTAMSLHHPTTSHPAFLGRAIWDIAFQSLEKHFNPSYPPANSGISSDCTYPAGEEW